MANREPGLAAAELESTIEADIVVMAGRADKRIFFEALPVNIKRSEAHRRRGHKVWLENGLIYVKLPDLQEEAPKTFLPVLPDWMFLLPLQQQSVLLLALRGPDGIAKHHPMKAVQRAYRGTILKAARYGRMLQQNEEADTFMAMGRFGSYELWKEVCWQYFQHIDALPHHFHNHLMHGAEILGYKHPDSHYRSCWFHFYERCCEDAHVNMETEVQMDKRLGDWGREYWT